jgi:hypothetical protein
MSLLHEMVCASRSVTDARMAEALIACGLDPRRHDFGVDWVTFSGIAYEPGGESGGDAGEAALIVPVCEGHHIVDLVACRLRDRRLATRRNVALALGEERVAEAVDRQGRLLLFNDPLRWLASDACGAVVLDWSRAASLFDGLPEIVCETTSLARRVHATTRRLADPPRLLVYQERKFKHAA